MLLLIKLCSVCDREDFVQFSLPYYVEFFIFYSLQEAIKYFWNSVEIQLFLQTRSTDDILGSRKIMRFRKKIWIFQNYEDHGKYS